MSLRQPVTRTEIERFLKRLGEGFRRPGRIYLVRGTTLVFEKLRLQTIDVDIVIEVAPEAEDAIAQLLRALKNELDINVELASPGDFIPLPAGYANRHVYVGRFGQLDVFHFDLYSTALSKISRGREQDFEDVIALLVQRRIEWATLEALFHEVFQQVKVGLRSLKRNPAEFEQNFRALEQQWRAAGGLP